MTARRKRRLALYYAALFLSIGLYLPFFPLYLDAIGVPPDGIGLVLTAPLLARLLAMPFLGMLADRMGSRADAVRLYTTAAAAGMAALLLTRDPVAIAITLAASAAFWGALIPVTDAAAVQAARAGGPDYGRVRLWGSIAFIAANLAGGWLVAQFTGLAVLPLIVAGFASAVLASLVLSLPPRTGDAAPRGPAPGRPAALGPWLVVAAAGLT